MYAQFWGLTSLPFENTPDPNNFLEAEQHMEALSRMLYVVQEKQACGVLTSIYGCGKTLILRRLRMELEAKGYRFSILTNPRLSDLDMLRMILHGFTGGIVPESKSDVLMALENVFTETARDGKHSVVIIDEGHAINNPDIFEELRLLLNFQTDTRYLVSLILAGQPELNSKIENNKQLNQRITLKYNLPPFTPDETADYINFRLAKSGARQQIFSRENCAIVHKYSGSIPRWINNICHMTLMNAFLRDSHEITPELIIETSKSFGTNESPRPAQ